MSQRTPEIAFLALAKRHWPLLQRWLNAPHMREWWDERDVELGMVCDMIEGRDTTQPFIFCVDGRPIGYIQVWHVADTLFEPWITEAPWLLKLPRDTVGVDLSIGEPNYLGRGLGTAALSAFVVRLRRAGYASIIIEPDPRNRRAVRSYAKAGFRPAPEFADPTGACLIMRHEPARSAVST